MIQPKGSEIRIDRMMNTSHGEPDTGRNPHTNGRRGIHGARTMGSKQRRRRRQTVYERQKGRCAKCPVPFPLHDLILRHKTHRLNGGDNTLDNLHLVCRPCYERGKNKVRDART